MTLRRTVVVLICAAGLAAAQAPADDPFVVPAILKDNVAFWKKIYTEVSLRQGLLHDEAYPLVIYQTIDIGDKGGRARRELLRRAMDEVEAALAGLSALPPAEWSEEQKRIKTLFDAHAPPDAMAGAAERLRFQQGQKERFLSGLERSGMYLDTIRAILAQSGIPQRLAFLPHVESSFDLEAYSKVGAAGIWQFMRSTGKLYLTVSYLVDERRDPVLATQAAAKLLNLNYQQLQSWPLAITAYNHGLGGMKHAVSSVGSRDLATIIERHASRTFKFASRNFYGCFIAASEIAADPNAYFGSVGYLPALSRADVALPSYIRPSVLAAYLDIPPHVLRELNPALRPVVFSQDKQIPAGYSLHVPASLQPKAALAAISGIPDSLRSDRPERPEYYRVRRGDNLIAIASRLGVAAEELAQDNAISRANRIFVGQLLRVPGSRRKAAAPLLAAAVPPAQEEETTVAMAPPARLPASAAASASSVSRDTLRDILLATADTSSAAGPAVARSRPTAAARFDVGVYNLETAIASPGMAEIRVSVDETLGHYADWLGIPTWRIRELNRMRSRSTIRVGQPLLIPLDEPDALERFAKTRLEYHMALEEDFYSRYKVADVKPLTVRRGETLWDLCSQEGGIPLWLFTKLNRQLDLGRLLPGMQVWLPVVDEKTEEDLALEQLEDGGIYPAYQEPLRGGVPAMMLLP